MKKTISMILALAMLCCSLVGTGITGYASTNVREAQLVEIGEEYKLQTTFDESVMYETAHYWVRLKSADAGAYVFWTSTGSEDDFAFPLVYRSITAAESCDLNSVLDIEGMIFDEKDETKIGLVYNLTANRSYYVDVVNINYDDEFTEPEVTFSINTHTHTYKNYSYPADTEDDGETGKMCTTCYSEKNVKTIPYVKTISLSRTSYTYSGKSCKPAVTIKDRTGKTLVLGTDYRISYPKDKVSVGTHTITIKFIGKYEGTVKKTYTIKPKGTSIKSLTASKKAFTAKWNKQTQKTTGYQLQYSRYSDFQNATTITFSKNTTLSKKVTGLAGGKKYYVRVRTYKTVNGKKIYSSWSKVKTVTTKKY